jgi:hypothetical protein
VKRDRRRSENRWSAFEPKKRLAPWKSNDEERGSGEEEARLLALLLEERLVVSV